MSIFSGKRTRRVSIQRNQRVKGDFGAEIDNWVDTGIKVWAKFEPELGLYQGMEKEFAEQQIAQRISYCTIRHPRSLINMSEQLRLVDTMNGRTWNINTVVSMNEQKREVRLSLKEVPTS